MRGIYILRHLTPGWFIQCPHERDIYRCFVYPFKGGENARDPHLRRLWNPFEEAE